MSLQEKQEEFIELFNSLESWQEKFQYLIELGSELPSMPEHLKTPQNRIEACLSKTFFCPIISKGTIRIEGWSNASIPSGMIVVLKNILEGVTLEKLKVTDIDFHIRTKLMDNLTEKRKDALNEMIRRIKVV